MARAGHWIVEVELYSVRHDYRIVPVVLCKAICLDLYHSSYLVGDKTSDILFLGRRGEVICHPLQQEKGMVVFNKNGLLIPL